MAKKTQKSAAKRTANRQKTAPPAAKTVRTPRRLQAPHKRFRRPKPDTPPPKLLNVWQLVRKSAEILWQYRALFAGTTLVYGLLNLVLVQGLASNTDITSLKNTLNHAFTGHWGSLASGLSVFAVLIGSAGNGSSQVAGAYQLFLGLIASLAVIWTLRQLMAGKVIRIRDGYYHGMYPLVPFILVLMVIGLQLLPLLIGSSLYSMVITNGIAVHFIEKLFWGLLFAVLAAWSLYMVSASVFAAYIVTLPDMTPVKALRSARELVRYRRWSILRKLLCLPVILLIGAAVIMVPIIIFLTALAQWVFFLLTMFGLVAVHTYMYTLYRELLNE